MAVKSPAASRTGYTTALVPVSTYLPNRTGVRYIFAGCCITRIIKSVVAEQAPVTLEWKNTPGNNATLPVLLTATYRHYIIMEVYHVTHAHYLGGDKHGSLPVSREWKILYHWLEV